jgi:hypothetical protein
VRFGHRKSCKPVLFVGIEKFPHDFARCAREPQVRWHTTALGMGADGVVMIAADDIRMVITQPCDALVR